MSFEAFEMHIYYQIVQRFSVGRTMASPALQLNAFWNSGELLSGPSTRYLLIGCGFVSTNWRCASGRISSPRDCPHEMKNCCSGVNPSLLAGRGLPSMDFSNAREARFTPPRFPMLLPFHQLSILMKAAVHGVRVELIDDAFPAILKFLVIRGRPPIFQLARCVELRALIVEAVRNLMPDDGADPAVVDGVAGIHVEHWRKQNTGREDDLVELRIVVGV